MILAGDKQVCEVHVRLVEGKGDAEHELSLQLKPGNSRAYKLNGKNKTAKEVKVAPSCVDTCPTQPWAVQMLHALTPVRFYCRRTS